MRARHVARVGVGYEERALREIRRAAQVMHAVEGKQQQLHAVVHTVDQVVHALDIRAIDAAGGFVHAAGIEIEQPPRVERRIEQALHLRVDVDAARGVAGADEMDMAVPDLRGVEAVPRRRDQLVVGEARRQRCAARIPDALLRPIAPGRDRRGEAGKARADADES